MMTEVQKKTTMKRWRCCKASRHRQRQRERRQRELRQQQVHLPEDMIFKILSLLSAESLCRYRSVSRQWLSMIQSPLFVSSHRARSSANPKLLLCLDDDDAAVGNVFSTAYPIHKVKDASSCWCSHGRIPGYVFASEAGLICSYDPNMYEIHVANPSTGERISSRTLPLTPPDIVDSDPLVVCFGYDPLENKHKVLVVRRRLEMDKIIAIADIFTVGGDESWRSMINPSGLPALLCLCSQRNRRMSICIDGIIYIFGRDAFIDYWLVAFDVRKETFRAVPVPEEASFGLSLCLLGFGGAPAFIERPRHILLKGEGEGEGIKFRLWILNDLCRQLWSSREFLIPSSSFYYPIDFAGVTSHGEVILYHSPPLQSHLTLYFYSLENSTIKTVYKLNAPFYKLEGEGVAAFYHNESMQPLRNPVPTTTITNDSVQGCVNS